MSDLPPLDEPHIQKIREELWGTPCPICEQPVTREAADDGIQFVLTQGEFRLVHHNEKQPCLLRGMFGHFDPNGIEPKRLSSDG